MFISQIQQINHTFLLFHFSLRAVRAQVWRRRTESPLFNVKTYATNLENLFWEMWRKCERGEGADHIVNLSSSKTSTSQVIANGFQQEN